MTMRIPNYSPLIDGNKCAALVMMATIIIKNGFELVANEADATLTFMALAIALFGHSRICVSSNFRVDSPKILTEDYYIMLISSFDGAKIHVTTMGSGRPLLLIHGFISSAQMNWISYGTAQLLVDAGYQVILPDLRGHGSSDTHCAFPKDVLSDDMIAVLKHFVIMDYDLVGYSLGARIAARLALNHLRPGKLVLSGMGLSGITGAQERTHWFIDAINNRAAPKDAAGTRVASFLKSMNMNAEAAVSVLKSQVITSLDQLKLLTMPTLSLSGVEDHDNGSAADLAAALPCGQYVEIPGNHMSAITTAEFGRAILTFLRGA
jgi:pimeloyl-ACP methyl ester carboxylesterase